MDFESAFIIIDNKEYNLLIDKNDKAAKFSINIPKGKISIESGFWLKNGDKTTAFYTDIELRVN